MAWPSSEMVKLRGPGGVLREELTAVKIALPRTGFGQAPAAVYAQRLDVDEVVVFGQTPEKLAKISGQLWVAAARPPPRADAATGGVPTGVVAGTRSRSAVRSAGYCRELSYFETTGRWPRA